MRDSELSNYKLTQSDGVYTLKNLNTTIGFVRFNENGEVESPAYITVFHNGVLIQNNSQIQGYVKFIGYPEYKVHASKLPIKLQDHSNLVSFRNIWIRNL